MDLAPGMTLQRFVLERKLGRGAAGVVFLARDTLLGQPVALKVLHAHLVENHEVRERFKREIVLTRRVSHPGVCRLHDVHEDDGLTFITMEYVEGRTLAEVIQEEKRLSVARTLALLRELAPPLQAAHEKGVVHRDLKPGNIMVRPDGGVSVLDFGMATADDVSRITHAGRTVGSLRFIAPEVWEGQPATAASDIYALGVVLYACLAGRLPYEASTPAEAFQAQRKPPASLVGLSLGATPALDEVVRRAMARKPADRFASATALARAFEGALASDESTATTGTLDLGGGIIPPSTTDVSGRHGTLARRAGSTTGDSGPTLPRPALWGAAFLGIVVVVAVAAALSSSEPPRREDGGGPLARPAPPAAAPPGAGPRSTAVAKPTPAEDAPAAVADDDRVAADDDPAPPSGEADDDGLALDDTGGEGAFTAPSTAPSGKQATSAASARAGLAALMKKRGFLPGDVPQVDALLGRSRSLEAKGQLARASALLERARGLAAREVIDRGFITAKQKRLRFASERASPASLQKIAALERDAEMLVVARDYAAANERLNRAFALLR